jgi:hypothetical protein
MREMKLGLFFAPGGHHLAAWRLPDAYPNGFSFQSYISAAQMAERGCEIEQDDRVPAVAQGRLGIGPVSNPVHRHALAAQRRQ